MLVQAVLYYFELLLSMCVLVQVVLPKGIDSA